MPKLVDLVDARSAASSIVNEAHVIGEDVANRVHLYERPDGVAAITIAGFTEVASAPAASEFAWVDGTNILEFNAADDGTAIQVSYDGIGSAASARDINRIHARLTGIQTLTDAATIAWPFEKAIAYVGLTASRTMDAPTGFQDGDTVLLLVGQTGAGNWTITWDAVFDFGDDGEPTLSTAAGLYDALGFFWKNGAMVFTGIKKGYTI